MKKVYVWNTAVRMFHWSLVCAFFANDFFIDHDSDLHQYLGYFVASLVFIRLILGVSGTGYARFSAFPISIQDSLEQIRDIVLKRNRIHLGHTPLGAVMIYNILLSLVVVAISGYLMTTDMFWGVEWTGVLHETSVGWMELSIVVHVGAVIFESKRTGVNLPKSMVTGFKSVPDEARCLD